LLPVTVHQSLQTVSGLRKGRSTAREAEPVGPVPEELVEKTLPHLSPQVAAMVRLQLLTGARPGEVVAIRPCDIERPEGAEVWVYRPLEHKTEHHDRQRTIFLVVATGSHDE
jgi:integrase